MTGIRKLRSAIAIAMCLLLMVGDGAAVGQQTPNTAAAEQTATKLPPEQIDSLVAPIALYPDPMLSQVLVASTYPLEVIQLHQWLIKNTGLKDKALADAVAKQNWDPSIQAMAALPDVVKQMADNMKWTTELGNAFLTQQGDVMDAVQRMRKKAQDAGNLKTTQQQKVETKVVEQKTVIVVEQADPQLVYVPSYNPVVVYGPPVYPYPPIAYPPPGYYAAGMAISFGVGVAMGAFWSGGWGWGCGWGHNDIDINVNNNFNRNNINNINNINRSGNRTNVGNTKWEHNPQHRGGAPYSDRATANKYGGSARGDSLSNRQATAQRNQARGDGGGRAQAGTMDRSGTGRGANTGNASSNRGGDRIGSREVPRSSGGDRSAFSGASSRSGGAARASSSRGASSYSGSRGGARGGRRR